MSKREVVDYYLYEIGLNKTLKLFKLNMKKLNNILFDTQIRICNSKSDYEEITEEIELYQSNDYSELVKYINDNYNFLFGYYSNLNKSIDARSYTKYDRFMNALTDLLCNNSDYNYVDDIHTLIYMITKLKKYINIDNKNNLRYYKMKNKYLELLNNGSYDGEIDNILNCVIENDNDNDSNQINKNIVNLLIEGYSQLEISKIVNLHPSNVSRRINKMINNNN
jgi:hypothetical protein